jgi:membrane fusion protein (multidrug efflux system)
VKFVTAKKMDVPLELDRNASTRAINQVTISARVKGFLQEILFTEGSEVKKGQLLLVIDEKPYQVAVAKAKAQLAEATAAVTQAKQSKSREIAKAKLDLSIASQTLESVQEQRSKMLFGRNAASKGDLDLAEAQLQRANALVESDKASLLQATADYDTNILEAQAKYDQAKTALDDAEINLGYCRMKAPINGRIGEALVKVGNLVGQTQDTPLATIQQLDPMGVDIEVASVYLGRVNRLLEQGLEVGIEVKRKDSSGESYRAYRGRVDFVDNSVARSTSNVLVKATVPNPDKSILPGEFAKMQVVVDLRKDAIVVPEKALMRGQAGNTVFVVVDSKVKVVRVEIDDDTYHGMRIIRKGVNEGDKVVVEGLQLIRDGMPVEGREIPFNSTDDASAKSPASEKTSEPAKPDAKAGVETQPSKK